LSLHRCRFFQWFQVGEAMSNKPVDRQEYYRLTRARDLLAECNTTVVLQ
jgi:hypothetical protein